MAQCSICGTPFPVEFDSQNTWVQIGRATDGALREILCFSCYFPIDGTLRGMRETYARENAERWRAMAQGTRILRRWNFLARVARYFRPR